MEILRNVWTGIKLFLLLGSFGLLVWMFLTLTRGESLFYSLHNLWRYQILRIDDYQELPAQEYHDPPTTGLPCSGLVPGAEPGTIARDWAGVSCPTGWGIIANIDGGSDVSGIGYGPDVPIRGTCCRLPFDDILTEDHVYNVSDRCPDNYVFTSNTGAKRCGDSCVARCTRINTAKYQLGPPMRAFYWKIRTEHTAAGWGWAKRVMHDQLPITMNRAVARTTVRASGSDGCVGMPLGSLLVRKEGKNCDGFIYRQLQYKDGSAVRIFPECPSVEGLDTPFPYCVEK